MTAANTWSTSLGPPPGINRFAGIVLQEYSRPAEGKLIGQPRTYFQGHRARIHRGTPSLQAEWLLLLADRRGRHPPGATRHDGAFAPIERTLRDYPDKYILTSATAPISNCNAPDTPTWWKLKSAKPTWCICAAGPFAIAGAARWAGKRRSSQWHGRPTAGCALRTDRAFPHSKSRAPALPPHVFSARPARGFRRSGLPLDFQWLCSPWPKELFSLTERPGHLRLYGRETMGSLFRQSLVARRQQAHCFSATTVIEFEPDHSSKWPAWSATTTAPSFITFTFRTTIGNTCG